jgi:hypothetical protein
MNDVIKSTLKKLVSEIDRLNDCEKELDISQAFMPTYSNVEQLRQLEQLRNSYQSKLNSIIKELTK